MEQEHQRSSEGLEALRALESSEVLGRQVLPSRAASVRHRPGRRLASHARGHLVAGERPCAGVAARPLRALGLEARACLGAISSPESANEA